MAAGSYTRVSTGAAATPRACATEVPVMTVARLRVKLPRLRRSPRRRRHSFSGMATGGASSGAADDGASPLIRPSPRRPPACRRTLPPSRPGGGGHGGLVPLHVPAQGLLQPVRHVVRGLV